MSESATASIGPVERWLPVVGYEGYYEVSDWGRVRSLHPQGRPRGKFLRPSAGTYLVVNLSKDHVRESWPVHRLVGEAFLGPLPPGMMTRHGPGGPYDNRLVNLSYGSAAENADDQVRDGTAVRRGLVVVNEALVGAQIDREGSIPLSVQLADILRAQIADGRIRPDRAIPSKRALVEQYEVGAHTVDRAVEVLRGEGLLYTVPGKGLYVVRPGANGGHGREKTATP
jgi:DNA-binding transcriptional regulator YhcF (GntR family)